MTRRRRRPRRRLLTSWAIVFRSLPFTARPIKATEAVLERIYTAARKGARGNRLAFEAGLLPVELKRLQEFDPLAQMAEDLARAELESEMEGVVIEAARGGDAKAAMDILKHRFDWKAAQVVQLDITQQISVIDALAQADQRLALANQQSDDVTDVTPRMLDANAKV